MDTDIPQQIFDQFNKSNRILIALPKTLTADNASSGLALAMILRKMGKIVDAAASGPLPSELTFLPQAEQIRQDLYEDHNLVIQIDTSVKPVEEVSYQSEN